MAAAKTTATKQEPLLDLNTLIERPKIKIDGKAYEILSPDELSILDSQRLSTWGAKLTELSKRDDLTDEMEELVGDIAGKILVGVPDTVTAKLSGLHKLQIVSVFTGLLLARTMGTAGALTRTINPTPTSSQRTGNPQIGAKSSRGSSGSSAARPANGSKKRRPRS